MDELGGIEEAPADFIEGKLAGGSLLMLPGRAAEGKMNAKDVARAIKEYKIDVEKANPIGV